MKKLLRLTIAAGVLLCGVLVLACKPPVDLRPRIPPPSADWALGWVWEIADDSNQTKFAAGVSILEGYKEHTPENGYPGTKYSQSYVLQNPYVSGQRNTGRHELITLPSGFQGVKMQDAKGFFYDKTKAWDEQDLYWPDNKEQGEKIPLKVPQMETTMGPYGADVQAFHFWGLLLQKGSESEISEEWVPRYGQRNNPATPTREDDYRLSCGWPAISLYATPDDEDTTYGKRLEFMDGYGYTFWVKSMKDYRCYRTSVENWDYRPNEGHEPGYWYGTTAGRDGTPTFNYTPAPPGEWTQVTVIYDPYHPDFNMQVNNWIYSYNVQNNYPGDEEPYNIAEHHDKDHSIRIAFVFQLQHNGGDEGTQYIEYSVQSGKHEFDVWLYGLQLLQY